MVVDDPPLNHDRYAIVSVNPPVPDHQKEFWLAEVCRIIVGDLEYELLDDFVYPLGIGCVVFADMESRDAAIREGPHALSEDSTFSLVPHDESINMRMPAFEYEAWVMFLAFPMDYQTEHYVHKAVSHFGKMLAWPRPGQNKARVLVKCHIKDVAEVPHSLVITRVGLLPGLARSWSVQVYVLNGRNTIPNLVGNEDTPPLLNASPHPYQLPYYTLMQQARIDEMVTQDALNAEAWNAPEPVNDVQNNGWGVWPVVTPPYTGFSFRTFFQYDGPSLMDGVDPEHNVQDNLSDIWSSDSEFQTVDALADGFVNGSPAARREFVRAGGNSLFLQVAVDYEFLLWIGGMLKRIYTPTITLQHISPVMMPLNPFQIIQNHLNAAAAVWIECMVPEPDIFSRIFASALQWGRVIVPSGVLSPKPRARSNAMNWDLPEQSPGLKALPQLVSADEETQMMLSSDQSTALQVLASSSVFNANQHRNMPVPLDTTTVRRSNRSNKYDGFKINHAPEARRSKSRVKPRDIPFVNVVSLAAAPVQVPIADCPQPMSIEDLQQMGRSCGIRPEAISRDKLLDDQSSSGEAEH